MRGVMYGYNLRNEIAM